MTQEGMMGESPDGRRKYVSECPHLHCTGNGLTLYCWGCGRGIRRSGEAIELPPPPSAEKEER